MIWKTKEFQQLVHECFGSVQVDVLKPSLRSIPWKLAMARYHADEAKKALQVSTTSEKDEYIEKTKQILLQASGSEESIGFSEAQFFSEAHVIAFAQCLHSIADILAQVIYHGLHFESRGAHIPKKNRNLSKVRGGLQKLPTASVVFSVVDTFLDSSEFKYIRAYVNTTKHQSLLDSRYSISFPDLKHGIKIMPFNYEAGKNNIEHWPDKWADDFTTKDFKVINEHIIKIGVETNNFLSNLRSQANNAV